MSRDPLDQPAHSQQRAGREGAVHPSAQGRIGNHEARVRELERRLRRTVEPTQTSKPCCCDWRVILPFNPNIAPSGPGGVFYPDRDTTLIGATMGLLTPMGFNQGSAFVNLLDTDDNFLTDTFIFTQYGSTQTDPDLPGRRLQMYLLDGADRWRFRGGQEVGIYAYGLSGGSAARGLTVTLIFNDCSEGSPLLGPSGSG